MPTVLQKMDGQIRGLIIRVNLGFYSLLVFQMAEEGNVKEVRAQWVPGMDGVLCGAERSQSVQSQGSVYSQGQG